MGIQSPGACKMMCPEGRLFDNRIAGASSGLYKAMGYYSYISVKELGMLLCASPWAYALGRQRSGILK